jgi:hypothetical protein
VSYNRLTSWFIQENQKITSELGRNNEVRSEFLQNYANVLDKYVAVNYINTENANISMADQFE